MTVGESGVVCVLIIRAEGKGTEEAGMTRARESVIRQVASWGRQTY